jgi:predicted O-methyltransferase YrrM
MGSLKQLLRYLNYYMNAKSKYKIHSPFIYDLLIYVIYYEQYEPEFEIIDSIRESLMTDETYLEFIDFGAKGKGVQVRKKIKNIAKRSSSEVKYSRLLFRLVKHFEPKTLLELGTSFGISTMYQALAAEKNKLITFEGSKEICDIARKNFKRLGLRNVEIINDNFDNALSKVLENIDKIDYVFFDGNHRKVPTINYFEQCLTKVHQDTVLIFDDIHWSDEMEEAWKYIQEHPEVVITIDLFFLGLVFFNRNTIKQNHIIRF